MFPREIQSIISNYQILGLLPLDKTLHFLVGAIVTIVLRWRGLSMLKILIILAVLEMTKEIIDSATLQSTFSERATDFAVTFIYPAILMISIEVKKKLAKRANHRGNYPGP